MDKITKALRKFSEDESQIVKDILYKLYSGTLDSSVNLKKLSGYSNLFRIRKGKIRIIYMVHQDKNIRVLTIDKRNDNTYNKFD